MQNIAVVVSVAVGILTILGILYGLRSRIANTLLRANAADALKSTTDIAVALKLADEVNKRMIDDLRQEIQTANTKVDTATKEIQSLKSKIDNMQRMYAEDRYILQSKIDEQRQLLVERDAELARKDAEIAKLRAAHTRRTRPKTPIATQEKP